MGQGGGAPGMNGDLRIYPKPGYVVAVLANIDPPAAARISEYLDARLPTRAMTTMLYDGPRRCLAHGDVPGRVDRDIRPPWTVLCNARGRRRRRTTRTRCRFGDGDTSAAWPCAASSRRAPACHQIRRLIPLRAAVQTPACCQATPGDDLQSTLLRWRVARCYPPVSHSQATRAATCRSTATRSSSWALRSAAGPRAAIAAIGAPAGGTTTAREVYPLPGSATDAKPRPRTAATS